VELRRPLRFLSALALMVGCSDASGHRPSDLKQLTLDAYIGTSTASQTREVLLEHGRLMEETVAACMRRQGFSYVPNLASLVPPPNSKTPIADLTSRTYAKEHGFGLVDPFINPPPASVTDPNDVAFQKLSAAEQAEYSRALDETDGSGTGKLSCRGEGDRAIEESSGGKKFFEDLKPLVSRVEAEPRVLDARTKWQACAKSAGYEFESRRSLIDSINRRIDATSVALPHDVNKPPEKSVQDRLVDIRRYEVAAAVATFDCSTAYDAVFRNAAREAASIR
jgi:hypothetical protein